MEEQGFDDRQVTATVKAAPSKRSSGVYVAFPAFPTYTYEAGYIPLRKQSQRRRAHNTAAAEPRRLKTSRDVYTYDFEPLRDAKGVYNDVGIQGTVNVGVGDGGDTHDNVRKESSQASGGVVGDTVQRVPPQVDKQAKHANNSWSRKDLYTPSTASNNDEAALEGDDAANDDGLATVEVKIVYSIDESDKVQPRVAKNAVVGGPSVLGKSDALLADTKNIDETPINFARVLTASDKWETTDDLVHGAGREQETEKKLPSAKSSTVDSPTVVKKVSKAPLAILSPAADHPRYHQTLVDPLVPLPDERLVAKNRQQRFHSSDEQYFDPKNTSETKNIPAGAGITIRDDQSGTNGCVVASVSTEKQLQDDKHANVFDDTQPRREDEVTREDEKESSEYYLFQCRKDYRDSDVAQPSPADVATATESFVSSESLVLSLESTAAADRRQLFTPPSIVQPPATGETTTASNQKKHAKDFALFSNGKDSEKSMKK